MSAANGRLGLGLARPRRQHPDAALPRLGEALLQQAGLADARVALEDQHGRAGTRRQKLSASPTSRSLARPGAAAPERCSCNARCSGIRACHHAHTMATIRITLECHGTGEGEPPPEDGLHRNQGQVQDLTAERRRCHNSHVDHAATTVVRRNASSSTRSVSPEYAYATSQIGNKSPKYGREPCRHRYSPPGSPVRRSPRRTAT